MNVAHDCRMKYNKNMICNIRQILSFVQYIHLSKKINVILTFLNKNEKWRDVIFREPCFSCEKNRSFKKVYDAIYVF